MSSPVYVSASIFYSSNSCAHLALNCLMPLLYKLKASNLTEGVVTALSFEKGDNIRLIIKTDLARKQLIEAICKVFVKKWLKSNPSRRNKINDVFGKQLWMNFNNNSIHFSLFRHQEILAAGRDNFALIYQSVSEQVVSFLVENNDFKSEDKITNVIFLYLAVFSSLPHDDALICIADLVKSNELQLDFNGVDKIRHIADDKIKGDFIQNKAFLSEFYYDLRYNDDDNLQRWLAFSQAYIKNTKDVNLLNANLIDLFKSINLYFGLGVLEEHYLFSFVQQFLASLIAV